MPSSRAGGGGSEVSGGHATRGWEALLNSVALLNEKVILEQRPKGSGQLGMAWVWERHILGRENHQYQYPKEEACLAYLWPGSLEVYQYQECPEPGQSQKRGWGTNRGLVMDGLVGPWKDFADFEGMEILSRRVTGSN